MTAQIPKNYSSFNLFTSGLIILLLAALLFTGCEDDKLKELTTDTITSDTLAPDTSSTDTPSDIEDTLSDIEDIQLVDVPAECPPSGFAPQPGTSCTAAEENLTCGECSPDTCDPCSRSSCYAGTWEGIEDFPDLFCGFPECDPLAAACDAGEGCYWAESKNRFYCMALGSDPEESPCQSSTPNSCAEGLICVENPSLGATTCQPTCRPGIDDGLCGGSCDAMGDHGYTDPNNTPIESIGYCYFQGG